MQQALLQGLACTKLQVIELFQRKAGAVPVATVTRCLGAGQQVACALLRRRGTGGQLAIQLGGGEVFTGGDQLVFLSSADWMGRNFFSRVETCFPIEDPKLKKRVFRETIETYLSDNAQAWVLHADGSYVQKTHRQDRKAAQEQLLQELADN